MATYHTGNFKHLTLSDRAKQQQISLNSLRTEKEKEPYLPQLVLSLISVCLCRFLLFCVLFNSIRPSAAETLSFAYMPAY